MRPCCDAERRRDLSEVGCHSIMASPSSAPSFASATDAATRSERHIALHTYARWCSMFACIAAGVGPMGQELRLQLSEEGADAERLAMLTGYLRAELLQLDVKDVNALPGGEPPPGSRVFGVETVGALLIALGQSAEGL